MFIYTEMVYCCYFPSITKFRRSLPAAALITLDESCISFIMSAKWIIFTPASSNKPGSSSCLTTLTTNSFVQVPGQSSFRSLTFFGWLNFFSTHSWIPIRTSSIERSFALSAPIPFAFWIAFGTLLYTQCFIWNHAVPDNCDSKFTQLLKPSFLSRSQPMDWRVYRNAVFSLFPPVLDSFLLQRVVVIYSEAPACWTWNIDYNQLNLMLNHR